jgi:hypothetical protein
MVGSLVLEKKRFISEKKQFDLLLFFVWPPRKGFDGGRPITCRTILLELFIWRLFGRIFSGFVWRAITKEFGNLEFLIVYLCRLFPLFFFWRVLLFAVIVVHFHQIYATNKRYVCKNINLRFLLPNKDHKNFHILLVEHL